MANEERNPKSAGKGTPWLPTRELVEGGLMVALATVLSYLKLWDAPYGGSVTLLSMVPIILYSLRWGVKPGLVAGLAHALIQLIQGMGDVMYVPTAGGIAAAIILDYLLPFTLLGLGGLFRGVKFTKNNTANLILAAALWRIKRPRGGQTTTTKLVVWLCLVNGIAWVWCSYLLAWQGQAQIAEGLSKAAVTEILGVVLVYALKSTAENLSKNNDWPDKPAKRNQRQDCD